MEKLVHSPGRLVYNSGHGGVWRWKNTRCIAGQSSQLYLCYPCCVLRIRSFKFHETFRFAIPLLGMKKHEAPKGNHHDSTWSCPCCVFRYKSFIKHVVLRCRCISEYRYFTRICRDSNLYSDAFWNWLSLPPISSTVLEVCMQLCDVSKSRL